MPTGLEPTLPSARDQGLKGNRLEEFNKIEDSIVKEKEQSKQLVTLGLPFDTFCLLVIECLLLFLFIEERPLLRSNMPKIIVSMNHQWN